MLEANYHTKKKFSDNFLAVGIKKKHRYSTKPVYLGLSILETSKTIMFELLYDYVKAKYRKKQKYVIWIQIALQPT